MDVSADFLAHVHAQTGSNQRFVTVIEPGECRRRDQLATTAGDELTLFQKQNAVGNAQGVFGLMGGQQDREATGTQAAQAVEHAQLIAEIQAGSGFVEDENFSLLGQRAGNQRELAFAARNFSAGAFGQVSDAQTVQGFGGQRAVLA